MKKYSHLKTFLSKKVVFHFSDTYKLSPYLSTYIKKTNHRRTTSRSIILMEKFIKDNMGVSN